MPNKPIAYINKAVIDSLALDCAVDTPIYIGETNIAHIQQKHPRDYEKYHKYIADILTRPDYVGINSANNSLEYVREFQLDNNEFVKVAVRVALSGKFFVRSLYTLNPNRVKNFIAKGTLKPLTKNK